MKHNPTGRPLLPRASRFLLFGTIQALSCVYLGLRWFVLIIVFLLLCLNGGHFLSILLFRKCHVWAKGGNRHLLHVVKLVGSHLILIIDLVKLLTNELRMIFCGHLLPNVFLYLLLKRFRQFLTFFRFKFFKFFHREKRILVNVVLKESCFSQSIFEDHEADAALHPLIPESSVDTPI